MEDGDEIATEAHRIAEERSYSPERFLALLDRGAYNADFEIWRLPPSQREILIPPLRTMARERKGTVRLNAAYALLELSDPAGCEVIVACLKTPGIEIRNGALDRLLWFGNRKYGEPQKAHAADDADAILAALDYCIGDSDPRIRRRAVQTMSYLRTPQALDRLTQLLGVRDWIVRTEAAIYLGLAGLDRGALAVLDERLNQAVDPRPGNPSRHMFVKAIENLCANVDPEISTHAAEVAARFVRRNLISGNEIANHIWNLLRGISTARVTYEPELLREVIASQVEWWARGEALKRLAELSGGDGIALLLSALTDSALREAAIEGLVALARQTRDPLIVEVLAKEIAREQGQNVSKIVTAYLAAGGDSLELLDSVAARVDAETAHTIYWLRTGFTPRKAAECLRPALVGQEPPEEKLSELEADWQAKPNAAGVLYALFAGHLTAILFKTVDAAADHAEVVTKLAAMTKHRLVLEDVVQTEDSDDELRIRFIHEGIGYMFSIRHQGRYINVDDVLAGLNGVLERLGFAERFIHITPNEVAAIIVFVRAEAFFAAAETLRIPLETDRIAAQIRPALPRT